MRDAVPGPQINSAKIPVGGGIAGAMVALISMLIFLIGIPPLRYFLPAAIVLGSAVALAIRLVRRETPGKPWIVSARKQ